MSFAGAFDDLLELFGGGGIDDTNGLVGSLFVALDFTGACAVGGKLFFGGFRSDFDDRGLDFDFGGVHAFEDESEPIEDCSENTEFPFKKSKSDVEPHSFLVDFYSIIEGSFNNYDKS